MLEGNAALRPLSRIGCALLATVAALVGAPHPAAAQVQLPSVNLGLTNFEDGFGKPGWFLQEFPTYFDSDTLKDANGATVPGPNELTTFSTTTHIVYVSPVRAIKGRVAFEALQPWADVDARFGNAPALKAHGFADLTLGAGVQWAPKKIGRGIFVHRFMLDVGVPSGRYDDKKPINIGNNYYVVDPYYAFTYEVGKVEVSARFHYLWNSINRSPYTGLGARSVQAGQAFHVNYAISYEIVPKLRVGFNGYWLKQLTDNKLNGIDIPNSREAVVGLGGGLQLQIGKSTWVHLNGYTETGARNRAQGSSLMFRLSRSIPG